MFNLISSSKPVILGTLFSLLFLTISFGVKAQPTKSKAKDTAEITVDCATDTVTAALESVAVTTPVTITIIGTCEESVFILRDHVTLVGNTPADGIAPAGADPAVFAVGASQISLQSLTLTGGSIGLGCVNGSVVHASEITVSGATFAGVLAQDGGFCEIANSTIDDSTIGILSKSNGDVLVLSSVIENNDFAGVLASTNGALTLTATFGGVIPVTLRNNARGGSVSMGSTIELGNAIIEDNDDDGLSISAGGTFMINVGSTAIIRRNGGDGLSFSPNTSAFFFSTDFDIINNVGFGVNCDAGDNRPPRGNVSISGTPSTLAGNNGDGDDDEFSGNCPL
jgi:hypothetical protein